MKESEYRIPLYNRNLCFAMGGVYIIFGCFSFDLSSSLVEGYPILSILLILSGLLQIHSGRNSGRILNISENGIRIRHKKKEWNAQWSEFTIVEDDLVSFIIKMGKEELRFIRKYLPKEVLDLLKDRTEDLSRR